MRRERSGLPATIVEVARERAVQRPEAPAYVFLEEGEREVARLSFGQLDRRARAIAAELQRLGAAGERVLLLYPSGLDYVTAFLGCLYAGAVAVPCDSVRVRSSLERLDAVVADARPRLALRPGEDAGGEAVVALDALPRLDAAAVPDEAACAWQAPRPDAGALAFLQYTSGSTRAPRGVMVTHGNLLANEAAIQAACGHDAGSTFVGWLPLFHDMGLIANVLQPLYLGSLSVLLSPQAFLKRPARWLRAVSRYRAHTSGGPNFAYDLCVERISAEEREALDLSGWRVAYNGAEVVRPATLERFAAAFAPAGFRREALFPCYGLAEATLFVAGAPRHAAPTVARVRRDALRQRRFAPAGPGVPSQVLVSSGVAGEDPALRIVDPDSGSECPGGRLGEIWIAGSSVAQGYWGRPEESAGTFAARLAGGEGPFLRSGDLGCLVNGELFITGRLKDVIVLRGQNHYPQDLEWTAELSHPALRPTCGAAFAVEVDGEERLVLAYELKRGQRQHDLEEVAAAARRAIAERHGVEPHAVALVQQGAILKTTSGKVRRGGCRDAFLAGKLPLLWLSLARGRDDAATQAPLPDRLTLAALDPAERAPALAAALLRLAAERSGAAAPLRPDQPVSALGLDSLLATELQHRLEQAYGVALPGGTLLGDATVAEVAAAVLAAPPQPRGEPAAEPRDGSLRKGPLSYTQRALWFEHEAAAGSPVYNLARAVRLRGPVDAEALRCAFRRLVRRHDALRTRFALGDGEPVQLIGDGEDVTLRHEVIAGHGERRLRQRLATEAERPFALLEESPVRATLFSGPPAGPVLLLVVHHLAADFWSLVVALRDLAALYAEETGGPAAQLPPLRASHLGHARAQQRLATSEASERSWRYWRRHLGGELPPLALPGDRRPPPLRSFRGATWRSRLDPALTAALERLAAEQGATLFATLLAGWQALLYRYSGQEDLIVGTLTAGRDRAELADLVGCFVNPLAIRATVHDRLPFESLLAATRRSLLEALAHGDYPFARLVERLRPARAGGRPVLIEAMLVLQKEYGEQAEGLRALALGVEGTVAAGALTLDSLPLPRHAAQLDLTLSMAQIDGALHGVWEYSTDLFREATVARMSRHFERLLRAAVADPRLPLGELPLLDPGERAAALRAAAGPPRRRPPHQGLHELVAARARRAPDAVAVAAPATDGSAAQLTYAALLRRAGALARRLRLLGAGSERRVGVMVERSLELPVALLGILRAGAAYLPLDPDEPPQRLAGLLRDAGLAAVVVQPSLRERLPEGVPQVVLGRDPAPANAPAQDAGPCAGPPGAAPTTHPEQAAYVLYTSGSTGTPKGVVVPHHGIVNRLLWMQETYRLTPADRVLHKTPLTFDVSLWELLWPLLSGACLVLARPGGHRDSRYLVATLAREQVTTVHFVPSMLGPFLDEPGVEELAALRRVLCSGEALPPELRRRCLALLGAELHNLYGPTEASVDVTAWRCHPGEPGPVPIGRPIANTQAHVLDARLEPVAAGLRGELYLGGVALARGYFARPALTAERFVPDPHGSAGGRLYRSGDRASRRRDGVLLYLGRDDQQVKIAGNRVELGEVEQRLRELPGVRDAAVVKRGEDLIAYVVAGRDGQPRAPELPALREALRPRLPGYMLPAAVVALERLPTTVSGKLDRRALPPPRPGPAPREPGRAAAARGTPTERRLAACWSEVLGLRRTGIDDDFFSAGGDSIRALRLVARARNAGLDLSVSDVLQHRTVRRLALALERRPPAAAGAGAAPFSLCAPATRADFPDDVEDAYPVSMTQRALLFHSQHSPGYEIYPTSLELQAAFDAAALRLALQRTMARHAYLRSSFDLTGQRVPLQLVRERVEPPLQVLDLRGLPAGRRAGALARWLRAERRRRFDLAAGPLVRFCVHRLADDRFQLTVSSFALDGWCVATIVVELLRDYGALLRGESPPLDPPEGSYADFVALEQRALGSTRQRQFWAAELAGAEACRLPRGRPVAVPGRPALQHRRTVPIEAEVAAGLRQLAEELQLPLKSVLLAAHLRVLRLLTGRPQVLCGLEVNGRPEQRDGDRLVGVFNNIVPLRVGLPGGSWAELARAAFEAEARVLPYRRYPLAELEREHRAGRLFDTLFVFTHFHVYQRLADLEGVRVTDGWAPDQTYVPLTVHYNLDALSAELRLLLDYDPHQLSAGQVAAVAGYHRRALRAMAAGPQRAWAAASLLSRGQERRRLAWSRGGEPAATGTVHGRVERQAARAPDAVAAACGDAQLTYRELLRRSGRLAAALRRRGAGPETVVGLHGSRRPELLVGLLGILRAGAAYLPLDPACPAARQRWMLADAGATMVVAAPGEPAPALGDGIEVVTTDAPSAGGAAAVPAPPAVHPDNLAYVVYTSGSTGTPKGVAVSHRGVVNYFDWCAPAYGIGPGTRLPVQSPVAADLTVTSLLAPLAAGGTARLLPDGAGPEALGEALLAEGYDVLKITPSHLAALGRQLAACGARPAVRTVVVGGERLDPAHLAPLRELAPGATFVNEYGPTETVVGCCWHPVGAAQEGPVPIGRPIAGMRAHVLDDGAPVPQGVAAELYVGGPGAARGYLGRPDLTAERFVPDPFAPRPGGRLYRTGDLASHDAGGRLHFHGRRDRQVKVRGYRVELDEVEAVLAAHPEVRAAAVVAPPDAAGQPRLVAHWVPVPGAAPDARRLRDWLTERLPAHMLPAELLPLAALPLTASGKVDHARLLAGAGEPLERMLRRLERLSDEEVRAVLEAARGPEGAPA